MSLDAKHKALFRTLFVWGLIVFGGLGLVSGLLMLPLAYFDHQRALQSRTWPTAPGRILESELTTGSIKTKIGFQTEYRWRVKYEFDLDGKTYSSEKFSLGNPSHSTIEADIRGIANRYPVGQQVQVYYEPNNPAMSVLETGAGTDNTTMYVMGGGGLFVGVMLVSLGTFLAFATTEPVEPSTPDANS